MPKSGEDKKCKQNFKMGVFHIICCERDTDKASGCLFKQSHGRRNNVLVAMIREDLGEQRMGTLRAYNGA